MKLIMAILYTCIRLQTNIIRILEKKTELQCYPNSVRDVLGRSKYGGGSNLTPPSKIHKNAPISLKIGTKVHNHKNRKKKKEKKILTRREVGGRADFRAPRVDFWQISSAISKISKF